MKKVCAFFTTLIFLFCSFGIYADVCVPVSQPNYKIPSEYFNRPPVKWNDEAAFKECYRPEMMIRATPECLEKHAEGNGEILFDLANLYNAGIHRSPPEPDLVKGFETMQKAAELGQSDALVSIIPAYCRRQMYSKAKEISKLAKTSSNAELIDFLMSNCENRDYLENPSPGMIALTMNLIAEPINVSTQAKVHLPNVIHNACANGELSQKFYGYLVELVTTGDEFCVMTLDAMLLEGVKEFEEQIGFMLAMFPDNEVRFLRSVCHGNMY